MLMQAPAQQEPGTFTTQSFTDLHGPRLISSLPRTAHSLGSMERKLSDQHEGVCYFTKSVVHGRMCELARSCGLFASL